MTETLRRIDVRDASIGAFLSVFDTESLISRARAVDDMRVKGQAAHPLAGVPIAVKDNIAVAGQRLTCGSRMLERYRSPFTATAVRRIEDAGLIVVGKTNMDEFGFGSSTENSAFFPTRNPHAMDRVPGGTSGGSAAAVAGGLVPLALGTDTGGSVRQPAALCGVVGYRPTYGRVSRYGLVAYASSMDQIGPMAGTVADAAALFRVIAGFDPLDATSLRDGMVLPGASAEGLRLGIPREYVTADCQADVLEAVETAAAVARRLGWTVRSVSMPLTPHALAAYYVVASVEAASNLARYDGVKYGHRTPGLDSNLETTIRSRTEGLGAEAKRRIMLGTYASSAGYHDRYYNKAMATRQLIAREFDSVFRDVDLLLTPVSPTTAWRIGERVSDPMAMYLSDVLSVPSALAGTPAMAIQVSKDSSGLPVGLQLCGPRLSDLLVIAACQMLEEQLGVAPMGTD